MGEFWQTLGNIGTTIGSIANPLNLIGGLGTAIGGLITGNQAQKSANKLGQQQIQAMYDINNANLQEQDKARQWQEMMFDRQNAYNNQSAVADRWREAGFNPYLMMSNGNMGAAASTPSAPQVATQQAPDFSGAIQAQQMVSQNNAINAQNFANNAQSNLAFQQSQYYGQEAMARIYSMYNSAKNDTTRTQLAKYLGTYQALNYYASSQKLFQDIRESKQNMKESASRVALNEINEKLGKKELQWFDDTKKVELANGISEIMLKYAQRQLTEREAITEIYRKGLVLAQTHQSEAAERQSDAVAGNINFETNVARGSAQYSQYSEKFWNYQSAKVMFNSIRKNSDWIDTNNYFNNAVQTFNAVSNGVNSAANVMSAVRGGPKVDLFSKSWVENGTHYSHRWSQ